MESATLKWKEPESTGRSKVEEAEMLQQIYTKNRGI